ncbi:YidC/Oxa1 family membrane protein insertase [Streptomyces sp. NPDC101118]|uniref:YidC/Oxa1 family membrane protein insertase n=1 Tax=Streptomyces sp. NPDC101118 TaxID=3366109 RepID=UPI003817FEAE
MSVFSTLVTSLAGLLDPVFAAAATAAAIVVFTLLVRVALYPLNRSAFRSQQARAALAPQVAELRRRHPAPKDAERLRKAVLELHAEAKVSPFAGLLPIFAQLPVFFVMYRVFSSDRIGGEVNALLDHRLFAAPLGSRWADALGEGGLVGAQSLVFLGLFAAIAAVATWTVLRARRAGGLAAAVPELGAGGGSRTRSGGRAGDGGATGGRSGAGAGAGAGAGVGAAGAAGAAVGSAGAGELPGGEALQKVTRWLPLLAFGTVVTAAVVPLAAGLYLLTTTAWTAAERAWLQWRWEVAARTTGTGSRSSL